MAHISEECVLETSTTTGTGAFTVAGALTGFRTFGSVMTAPSDTCWYAIRGVDSSGNFTAEWELGVGTYSASNTLTRTTVRRSSNANAAVNFSAGDKWVMISPRMIDTNLILPDNSVSFPVIASEPANPSSGSILLYGKTIAGQGKFRTRNAQGLDFTVQNALAYNKLEACFGGAATPTSFGGFTVTSAGGAASAAMSSTNFVTSALHTIYATTATAGTLGTLVCSPLRFWRGNSSGLGGYNWVTRISLLALQAGMRVFAGLCDSVTPLTNTTLLNTNTTPGRIGLSINASTGNWDLIHNVTASAPTIIGLGASFPVDTTSLMELELFCAPNDTAIGYRVRNLSTGAEASGTLSTNIPAATTFMCPSYGICNNATAAIASMRFYQWIKESDN